MRLQPFVFTLCLSVLLSACQSTSKTASSDNFTIPLVAPLTADFHSELGIARLSKLLNEQPDLTQSQRAKLYFDRGALYSSLGLSTLAHIDFQRAVKLKPDLAEVYNFLGIHYTLTQQYEQAYEMFDSAIELDEKHQFAYLNRGIALYYAERPALAAQDFATFLAFAPDDPYRVLWQYLAQKETDPAQAQTNLLTAMGKLDPQTWAYQLVAFYAGALSDKALIEGLAEGAASHQEYAQRACEAYFYLAKHYQALGETAKAIHFFKLALATNVYEFVEHKYARLELALLAAQATSG